MIFFVENASEIHFTEVTRLESAGRRLIWKLSPAPPNSSLASLPVSPDGVPQLGKLNVQRDAKPEKLTDAKLQLLSVQPSGVFATETAEPLDAWTPRRRIHDGITGFDTWFDGQFAWCEKSAASSAFAAIKGRDDSPLCCIQDDESDWQFVRRLLARVTEIVSEPVFLVGASGHWRCASAGGATKSTLTHWSEASSIPRDEVYTPSVPAPLVGFKEYAAHRADLKIADWRNEIRAEAVPFQPIEGRCAIVREDILRQSGYKWETRAVTIPVRHTRECREQFNGPIGSSFHVLHGKVTVFDEGHWELVAQVEGFEAKHDEIRMQLATLNPGPQGTTGWHIVPAAGARIIVLHRDLSEERPAHVNTLRDWSNRERKAQDARALGPQSISTFEDLQSHFFNDAHWTHTGNFAVSNARTVSLRTRAGRALTIFREFEFE